MYNTLKEAETMTANNEPKRYRIQVTLDEELYKQMKQMAEITGLGMATTARMILQLGFDISNRLKKETLEQLNGRTAKEG